MYKKNNTCIWIELIIEIIHTRNFLSYEDCFALHMATAPLHTCTSISFNINMQIFLFIFSKYE